MKRYVKKIWVFILCLTLCVGNIVPVMAANADDVTFSVALDKGTIQKASVDQTVVMTLSASEAITAESVEFEVVSMDAEGTPVSLTVSAITAGDNMTNTEWQCNLTDETYKASWMATSAGNVESIRTIVSITLVIPADTEAGTYTVGVNGLEITKDYGDIWESGGSAATTLTITEAAATGYTAGISATESAVEVDGAIYIPVAVSHASEENFNACEITITYDSTVLSFDSTKSNLGTAKVSEGTGTLTLADYGEAKNCGTGVYTLAFTASKVANNSVVTITEAGFTNVENAAKKDLTAATLSPTSVSLTISEKSLPVSIDSTLFKGSESVNYGEDYTFSLADDGAYYKYSEITATMGGTSVEVLDNNDGTYTIASVTGTLVISCAGRTEKEYTVSFEGTGAEDTAALEGNAVKATYNTAYTFILPAVTNDYVYTLDSVTIGGAACTDYELIEGTYTIKGANVKGNIVITVTKSENSTGIVTVTLEGSAGDVTGAATVQKGSPYILTLTPEAGYVYDVTATMGGLVATLTEGTDDSGNTTYTIANVTGAIVFNITKTADTNGISVSQYITLNGTIMWLVENTTAVAEGKVPTYDGEEMFWSDAYGSGADGSDADGDDINDGAYCYLVISNDSADNVLAAAKTALGITTLTGTVTEVAYDNDVNETNKVDASDAQLVWNMYKAQYSDFTEDVTMAKFLEADVNKDKKVDTTDAAAIISVILD